MENQDSGPPSRRAVAGHGPLGRRGPWAAGQWAFGPTGRWAAGLFLAKPQVNLESRANLESITSQVNFF